MLENTSGSLKTALTKGFEKFVELNKFLLTSSEDLLKEVNIDDSEEARKIRVGYKKLTKELDRKEAEIEELKQKLKEIEDEDRQEEELRTLKSKKSTKLTSKMISQKLKKMK